jgi:aspartyl-tRNA(Asn)/glutamyl-tRNA(Gln) amidotransferase subunit C
MALSLEQVRHVATLARLSLTPEEEQLYQGQLSAILEAIETLSKVDTAHVEPTSHASMADGTWRDDAVQPSLPPDKGLANAPSKHGTLFAVPKILE